MTFDEYEQKYETIYTLAGTSERSAMCRSHRCPAAAAGKCRMSGYKAIIEDVRFAEDSPLEGTGFVISLSSAYRKT
jgi:hypothetical protein